MPSSRPVELWRLIGFLGVGVASVLVAACATASSPDAWDAFRPQIAERCAAVANLHDAEIRIDSFGTDSYGLASITGRSDDGSEKTLICVMRKSPDGVVGAEVSAGLEEWIEAPN